MCVSVHSSSTNSGELLGRPFNFVTCSSGSGAVLTNEDTTQRTRRSSSSAPLTKQHIVVQHDYHDYANAVEPEDASKNEEAFPGASGIANATFPVKLYDMLERVDVEGLSDIVSWQPHGRSFLVHKPDEFVKMLPHYFNQKKLSSFQRQLNLYGFKRLTKGAERGSYYHERFLRSKPFLMSGILRSKIKGTRIRARSNPSEEPDLWKMPWVGEKIHSDAPRDCIKGCSSVVSEEFDDSMDGSSRSNNTDIDFEEHEDQEHHISQGSSEPQDVLWGWGMPFYPVENRELEIKPVLSTAERLQLEDRQDHKHRLLLQDDLHSLL